MVDDGTKIVEPDHRQMPPPREAAPGAQILNADTARSGPLGKPVLLVLLVSMATAVFFLGAYLTIWSSTLP
jgi:hypothetical protein